MKFYSKLFYSGKNKTAKSGFTLVEILIAIALVALLLPAISMLLSFSTTAVSQGEKYSQATSLAQEQMEAIFFIKNSETVEWDWTSTPSNTLSGESYQPDNSGGSWQLGSKILVPSTSQGFTKKVEIIEVRRCGMDICDIGAIDDYSRKVKVLVSWKEKDEDKEVNLESIVTKI